MSIKYCSHYFLYTRQQTLNPRYLTCILIDLFFRVNDTTILDLCFQLFSSYRSNSLSPFLTLSPLPSFSFFLSLHTTFHLSSYPSLHSLSFFPSLYFIFRPSGENEGDEPVILTDILGLEDALGTMDFKGKSDSRHLCI